MPPLPQLEDYIELLAAIEDTAEESRTPIVIEGYTPPKDYRLKQIKITPDPGVIEVNVHPANDWDELIKNTTAFYEEARLSRLGTEKFMLDGRHSGTGGGNHIVLGGHTAADTMFSSASKPGQTQWLGIEGLRAIVAAVTIPVLAIGGIAGERVGDVAQTGAGGFAAIELFMAAHGGVELAGCRVVELRQTVKNARSRFDRLKATP